MAERGGKGDENAFWGEDVDEPSVSDRWEWDDEFPTRESPYAVASAGALSGT